MFKQNFLNQFIIFIINFQLIKSIGYCQMEACFATVVGPLSLDEPLFDPEETQVVRVF